MTFSPKYTWKDWRPIGMLDLAMSHLIVPKNPDGFLGVPDQSDISKVIDTGVNLVKRAADRLSEIDAQGWYCHSLSFRFTKTNYSKLSRVEYQNIDNRPMGCLYESEKTDGMPLLEYMMKYLLDRGFPGGFLLRPSYPRGNFTQQWPSALGGRYLSQIPIDRERIFDYLKPRIEWAYQRGARYFYYDSPWKEDYSGPFLTQFIQEYPDCLLFPEINHLYNPDREWLYQYGPAWSTYNLNTEYSDKGYKCLFSVDQSSDLNNEVKIRGRIEHALDRKHIVCSYIWFDSKGYLYLKDSIHHCSSSRPGLRDDL